MKISFLLSIIAASLAVASAQQLADDPPSYFDAINHGAYLNWLTDNQIETRYKNSVYMPSMDEGLGAAVHWSVDDEHVYFAVAARASGWLGFGLSDVGGMLGSDMALFSMNRPNEIVDAHVVETYYPQEDDCQSDWIYVNSSTPDYITETQRLRNAGSDEFIMIEVKRKLVTNDPQDLPIVRDSNLAVSEHRIISAWGNTPDVSFHGSNVARGSIRVFKQEMDESDFDQNMADNADGSFFVGAQDYEIPSNDTIYANFCISRSDIIAQGVPNTTDLMSVIGFKPIIDEDTAPFVHHFVMTGKFDPSDNSCGEGPGFDIVFVWAPGDSGFAFPDFLGGNLFGNDGFQGFNVEIHYDNPRMESGHIDSSGVEIFYTTIPRPVEVGVMQIGDPFVSLYGQPVGNGLSGHHFDCPGSCSDIYLPDGEPVTVIREYLHMHVAGTRTINEQIRNGEVIRTASTEVWEFDQNGNVPVKQQPYEVQPGDAFRMSCYYRGNQASAFGLGSREEMCIAFLYYYPRKTVTLPTPNGNFSLPWTCGRTIDWLGPACDATYVSEGVLEQEEDMNRLFGRQPEQCLSSGATAEDPEIVLDLESSPDTVEEEEGAASDATPDASEDGDLDGTSSVTEEASGAGIRCLASALSLASLVAVLY